MSKQLRSEIPMNSLEDLRTYHQAQMERFQRLADSRNPKGFQHERTKLKGDLSQVEFHRRTVATLDKAIKRLQALELSELHVQAALL